MLEVGVVVEIRPAGGAAVVARDAANQIEGHFDFLPGGEIAPVEDEFPAAKVVKTTTFGAFVELAKGTDGLLHISNVSPGQRVDTVEEVLNKGDEISVRVVEVDKERGRIGLRLAEDPDIAGKTKEELAAIPFHRYFPKRTYGIVQHKGKLLAPPAARFVELIKARAKLERRRGGEHPASAE